MFFGLVRPHLAAKLRVKERIGLSFFLNGVCYQAESYHSFPDVDFGTESKQIYDASLIVAILGQGIFSKSVSINGLARVSALIDLGRERFHCCVLSSVGRNLYGSNFHVNCGLASVSWGASPEARPCF